MTKIIKLFGWLAIISSIPIFAWHVYLPGTVLIYPFIISLGLASLLGGALLVTFARVVELLQKQNEMIAPISRLAVHMEERRTMQ